VAPFQAATTASVSEVLVEASHAATSSIPSHKDHVPLKIVSHRDSAISPSAASLGNLPFRDKSATRFGKLPPIDKSAAEIMELKSKENSGK
jgi:hypothetical protein